MSDEWELIRHCIFKTGNGTADAAYHHLYLYDPHRQTASPQYPLAYRLTYRNARAQYEVFRGDDFGASPLHAIDSDETVMGLMDFLCLRPGDTDSEYFARDDDVQTNWRIQHADVVWMEVHTRFDAVWQREWRAKCRRNRKAAKSVTKGGPDGR